MGTATQDLRLSPGFQDNVYAAVRLSQAFDALSGIGMELEPKAGANTKHIGSAIWDTGTTIQNAIVRDLDARYANVPTDDIRDLTDRIVSDLTTYFEAMNENPSKQIMADSFIATFERAVSATSDETPDKPPAEAKDDTGAVSTASTPSTAVLFRAYLYVHLLGDEDRTYSTFKVELTGPRQLTREAVKLAIKHMRHNYWARPVSEHTPETYVAMLADTLGCYGAIIQQPDFSIEDAAGRDSTVTTMPRNNYKS